jgi:2-hydroxy-3-keto-5-methylthiopentenyl-1-phosphate phosphatase
MSNKEYNIGDIVHYIKDNNIDTGVIKGCEGGKYLIKDIFNKIIRVEKINAFDIMNDAWKMLHNKR